MKNKWSNLDAKKYINYYKKKNISKELALRIYTTHLLESEKKLVRVGQIATGLLVITGMLWIPFQKSLSGGGLFQYIQGIQAYISPPIAAAFLLGLFIKRINSQGVMSAFGVGALLGVGRLISEIQGSANINFII